MPLLSVKAQYLLGLMPPFMAQDPWTQALFQAFANECQRVEDTARTAVIASIPGSADDATVLGGVWVARLLSMWEALMGLPVAPAGVSVAERRSTLIAHRLKRHAGEGVEWVEILAEILRTLDWTYEEGPGDYQVSIFIPYASGSYSAGQVASLARAITPAHLQLLVSYNQGWLAGVSLTDVDPIYGGTP